MHTNAEPVRMADVVSRQFIYRGWASFSIVRIRLDDQIVIERVLEDHGRAVAVLPYDPSRRLAMLVEQMRPALLVTSGLTHSREVPAGILEDDDPADCARREALEECGLRLREVEHVSRCWTMPGISTEQMDMYLAAYEARDRIGPGGGVSDEHERITVVEVPLRELAAAADAGALADLKTFVLVQTLRLRRPDLFA
jgi:nudix-type nucleoside diphosphatase (YffH/AdpP family)